jgi:hypothetical protein
MFHSAELRNIMIAFIALSSLHFFLFYNLFSTINTLRSDVLEAILVSTPLPFAIEDAEKWKSDLLLNSNIPIGYGANLITT